jgi:hypothetical protein
MDAEMPSDSTTPGAGWRDVAVDLVAPTQSEDRRRGFAGPRPDSKHLSSSARSFGVSRHLSSALLSRGIAVAAMLVGTFALVSSSAGATTAILYVASRGSTTRACAASATACATTGYALTEGTSGETIDVGAGTFDEQRLSLSYPVTIVGAGASSTTIDMIPFCAPDHVLDARVHHLKPLRP